MISAAPIPGSVRPADRGRWFGAYPALVTDLNDPDRQGRVKVSLPWSPDGDSGGYQAWARLATLMAGSSRGTWFIPDKGDEVLVVFVAGDASQPCIVGGLWNGSDSPPESMDAGSQNNIKSITSRNGIRIEFDDTQGSEKLTLETPKQSITLDDGAQSITIKDASGNTIKLDSQGVSITASAKVKVETGQMNVSAGMVQVDSGMSKFSGVVNCDTLITNSVVSSSYTPGAGNVW